MTAFCSFVITALTHAQFIHFDDVMAWTSSLWSFFTYDSSLRHAVAKIQRLKNRLNGTSCAIGLHHFDKANKLLSSF